MLSVLAHDLFALAGLLITLVGAGVTARAVILWEGDALAIGLPRFASEDREENLEMPMVRNLLWSSRAAKWGLTMVAMGTFLQVLPIVLRLIQ